MARILVVVLSAFMLLGASECSGSGGDTVVNQQSPQSHPVYESGDLGAIDVLGTFTEARARFTLNADELALAVIADADYVPAAGNSAQATAELWIYDTKEDQDADNDVLVGMLPVSSPFSRARLSVDQPGSFMIRTPLGSASDEKAIAIGGTYSVRLRLSTSSWHGTVTSYRIRVVTLKGAELRTVAQSFVRDQ